MQKTITSAMEWLLQGSAPSIKRCSCSISSHIKFSLQAAKSHLSPSQTVSEAAALCIKLCNTLYIPCIPGHIANLKIFFSFFLSINTKIECQAKPQGHEEQGCTLTKVSLKTQKESHCFEKQSRTVPFLCASIICVFLYTKNKGFRVQKK